MAKRSVETTLFGIVVREAEGCIYTNLKDKYELFMIFEKAMASCIVLILSCWFLLCDVMGGGGGNT